MLLSEVTAKTTQSESAELVRLGFELHTHTVYWSLGIAVTLVALMVATAAFFLWTERQRRDSELHTHSSGISSDGFLSLREQDTRRLRRRSEISCTPRVVSTTSLSAPPESNEHADDGHSLVSARGDVSAVREVSTDAWGARLLGETLTNSSATAVN